jgi:hypothetical protein
LSHRLKIPSFVTNGKWLPLNFKFWSDISRQCVLLNQLFVSDAICTCKAKLDFLFGTDHRGSFSFLPFCQRFLE